MPLLVNGPLLLIIPVPRLVKTRLFVIAPFWLLLIVPLLLKVPLLIIVSSLLLVRETPSLISSVVPNCIVKVTPGFTTVSSEIVINPRASSDRLLVRLVASTG